MSLSSGCIAITIHINVHIAAVNEANEAGVFRGTMGRFGSSGKSDVMWPSSG